MSAPPLDQFTAEDVATMRAFVDRILDDTIAHALAAPPGVSRRDLYVAVLSATDSRFGDQREECTMALLGRALRFAWEQLDAGKTP